MPFACAGAARRLLLFPRLLGLCACAVVVAAAARSCRAGAPVRGASLRLMRPESNVAHGRVLRRRAAQKSRDRVVCSTRTVRMNTRCCLLATSCDSVVALECGRPASASALRPLARWRAFVLLIRTTSPARRVAPFDASANASPGSVGAASASALCGSLPHYAALATFRLDY